MSEISLPGLPYPSTAIQTDIFNTDSSSDDIASLKNKLQKLIDTIDKKM
jgi:hypothetical protein